MGSRMKHETRSLIWPLALVSLLAASCASELEDPDRFLSPVGASGGSTSAGTGGTGAMGGTPAATGGMVNWDPPPDCVQLLMPTKCASLGCHAAATASFTGGLDLSVANASNVMVDQPSTYANVEAADKANCVAGRMRIDSQNPMMSDLYLRLHDMQACGYAMPYGTPLTGDDLTCFESWILSYAN